MWNPEVTSPRHETKRADRDRRTKSMYSEGISSNQEHEVVQEMYAIAEQYSQASGPPGHVTVSKATNSTAVKATVNKDRGTWPRQKINYYPHVNNIFPNPSPALHDEADVSTETSTRPSVSSDASSPHPPASTAFTPPEAPKPGITVKHSPQSSDSTIKSSSSSNQQGRSGRNRTLPGKHTLPASYRQGMPKEGRKSHGEGPGKAYPSWNKPRSRPNRPTLLDFMNPPPKIAADAKPPTSWSDHSAEKRLSKNDPPRKVHAYTPNSPNFPFSTEHGSYNVPRQLYNPSPSQSQPSSTPSIAEAEFPGPNKSHFRREENSLDTRISHISPSPDTRIPQMSPSPSLWSSARSDNSLPPYFEPIQQPRPSKPVEPPRPGESREVYIERGSSQLGINIEQKSNGGVFVSSVTENSLAEAAGLVVGDRLLELCGINTRNATYSNVARVLHSCGGSIKMLVEYSPDAGAADFQEETSTESEKEMSDPEPRRAPMVVSSFSKAVTHHKHRQMLPTWLTKPQVTAMGPVFSRIKNEDDKECVQRLTYQKTVYDGSPDFDIYGGNAVGIYIVQVQPQSPAAMAGLKAGDKLLEINGNEMTGLTAEAAFKEIARPMERVSLRVVKDYQRYVYAINHSPDAFYVKATFDYQAKNEGELNFHKDDILFVENTRPPKKPGYWKGWLVDEQGRKLASGLILSKNKLEEEYLPLRTESETGEEELKRQGSNSTRRSFFRRKNKPQRSASKDSGSKDACASEASFQSDFICEVLPTYEQVQRIDSDLCRPVLLLGPLADVLIRKLVAESPNKFRECPYEFIKPSEMSMDKSLDIYIEFQCLTDGQYRCISVKSVRQLMTQNFHCMMNIHPDAIERMYNCKIYPIVVFIKFESQKHLKEMKDSQFIPHRLSSAEIKDLLQTNSAYEQKYKRNFSDVISGNNLAQLSIELKKAIDKEQSKTLWVTKDNTL